MNAKHIARYIQKPEKGDYRTVKFKAQDGTEYSLDTRKFMMFNKFTQEYSQAIGGFKEFFKMIGENPLYTHYEIKINTEGTIIKINDMPMQVKYLNEFYQTHHDFENYALKVQKFGRFKKDKLEYMNAEGTDMFHKFKLDEDLTNLLQKKQELTRTELSDNPRYSCVALPMLQHWRFTMGMGNASAYNNGFTFHPVYGIPYLPGQNIKGILRNYIINECFPDVPKHIMDDDKIKHKMEHFAEQDETFCKYFGCSEKSYDKTARAGSLMFLDAFPFGDYTIEPDIMNPHYGEYYNDETNPKAPHDAMKLTPIIFLSMKGARFTFCIFSSKVDLSQDVNLNGKKAKIQDFLTDALKYKGIGAKTKVGYGRLHT